MKAVICLVAVLGVVAAEEFYQPEVVELYEDGYPLWYNHPRQRRDVTADRKVGDNGRVFGTLGQNDAGLFGKAGYDHSIFNDNRGKLDGSLHGTRVLGPNGDSSHLGGGLNWKNNNAAANFDVNKQIGGRTSYDAGAGGRWPLGRNGDVTAQGFYSKTEGMRHDYGGRANLNYRW